MIEQHISRIKDALSNQFSLENLAGWIQKNTYLNGRLYSFKDYEFQQIILTDTAKTSIIVKCAQVGLSELAYRYAVATCCTQRDWNLIYTFPTSTDAETNNRQRIDPMIQASPELTRLIDPSQNNSSVKKFGANSFLLFKGTKSETQALSTPANAVIHDEVDKSDPENMSTYVSRLQDKPHKIRKMFSTPTIDNWGISKAAKTANRYKHLIQCNKCNHYFLPDYFSDVKIPGWDNPKEDITARNLNRVNYRQAYLACPKCGRDPEMHHTRMHMVCENPEDLYDANAWFISPFSAHRRISVPYLVKISTEYERYSEFKNQSLGITAEDKNEQLAESDFKFLKSNLHSSNFHCMGIDVGQTCHITIGRVVEDGSKIIVKRERCHLSQVEKRSLELTAMYKVLMTVWDRQPETSLVDRICNARPNNYGAMFVTSKGLASHIVIEKEEDKEAGEISVKQVKLNRTNTLDNLRDDFKKGQIIIQSDDDDDLYVKQCMSLKRVQKFVNNELSYIWEKTGDEDDHFHFSTLYLDIAIKIRGVASGFGLTSLSVLPIAKTSGPQYHANVAVARPIIKIN